MSVREVVIIGAGPAGIAAVVQLCRHEIRPVVFEAGTPGGLLINAFRVENMPGFPRGISGPALVKRMVRQLSRLPVEFIPEEVQDLSWDGTAFRVRSSRENLSARTVVVATGTRPGGWNGPVVDPGAEERIHPEIAGLAEVRGERIAVLGGGDAAFDYALNLARRNRVLLLIRGPVPRCLPLLQRRVSRSPRIQCRRETLVRRVRRRNGYITLDCRGPRGTFRVDASRLVTAVGREPRLEFLGAPIRDLSSVLVEMKRLFFVGDVKNGRFRQAAISFGDGIRAAMEIACEWRNQ